VNLSFVRQTNQHWKDLILIEIKRTGVDGSDFLDWPEAQVRGVDLQRAGFLSLHQIAEQLDARRISHSARWTLVYKSERPPPDVLV
jgi:hypothetical protein